MAIEGRTEKREARIRLGMVGGGSGGVRAARIAVVGLGGERHLAPNSDGGPRCEWRAEHQQTTP